MSRFSVSLTVEGATPRRRAISRVATPAENFRRMISRASRMGTLSAGIVCSLGMAKGADLIRPAAALATLPYPGGIIPFRWAASSRNGGRHHSVTAGDIISFWWAASPGISTRNGGAKAGSASWDSGCGRSPPHLERFVSEDSERGAGCEMALDIESVVDDGVSGEETLG